MAGEKENPPNRLGKIISNTLAVIFFIFALTLADHIYGGWRKWWFMPYLELIDPHNDLGR